VSFFNEFANSDVTVADMKLHWCQEPENGLLRPDLVFLLTLSENEMAKRPNFGDERYENTETQEKVAKAFLDMSREQGDWEVVPADGSIEDVHKVLLERAVKKIAEVERKSIRNLNFESQSINGLEDAKNKCI
jgi:dTMP kinase